MYLAVSDALTQEEQKYANIFLHDIERGDVIAEDGKTLRDYITEYQFRAKDDQIHRFATIFGLDEDKLRNMMGLIDAKRSLSKAGHENPHNEAAGQLKWLKTPLRQSGAGVFFLSPTCQMPHRIVYLAHNIPSRCVQ